MLMSRVMLSVRAATAANTQAVRGLPARLQGTGPRRLLCTGGPSGPGGRLPPRAATGGSGGMGGDASSKRGLWASYLELLETQPMLSRSITCALLNGLGDAFSQLVVEKIPFSGQRCTTFTLLGLLYIGPMLTVWYGFLGSAVTAPGLQGVITSLVLDQAVFAPVFIASIMAVLTGVEGKPQNIMPKLRQDWPDAVKVNWLLWVPAQWINFQFVPPNLRVLAVNVVALSWNVYMSWKSHKVVEGAPQ